MHFYQDFNKYKELWLEKSIIQTQYIPVIQLPQCKVKEHSKHAWYLATSQRVSLVKHSAIYTAQLSPMTVNTHDRNILVHTGHNMKKRRKRGIHLTFSISLRAASTIVTICTLYLHGHIHPKFLSFYINQIILSHLDWHHPDICTWQNFQPVCLSEQRSKQTAAEHRRRLMTLRSEAFPDGRGYYSFPNPFEGCSEHRT